MFYCFFLLLSINKTIKQQNIMNNHAKTIVIIGNGMVSHKFCEKLIAKTTEFKIIIFNEGPICAYDRVHLTDYLKKTKIEGLYLSDSTFYEDNNIDLHLNDPVIALDTQQKLVQSKTGIQISYDFIVFATGSAAFVPPIPGIDKKGVFLYRTIEDLDQIKAYASKAKKGVVIGGGLLGL